MFSVAGAWIDGSGLGLGVAREEHRKVVPASDEHEAEQVRVLGGLAEKLPWRPEGAQMESARIEVAAPGQAKGLGACCQGRTVETGIGTRIDDPTHADGVE